jgi:hypothetical protein
VPVLDKKPELFEDLWTFWHAFFDLHRTRTVGMSVDPIQPTNVLAWLDIRGVRWPMLRQQYYELVAAMDAAFLAWNREQQDAKK